MPQNDQYTSFQADEGQQRLLRQEELILEVTEEIVREMQARGIRRTDLAQKLGKTRGYITQLLGGGRNLTLRTLSDVSSALDCKVVVGLKSRFLSEHKVVDFPASRVDWHDAPRVELVGFRGLVDCEDPTPGEAVA